MANVKLKFVENGAGESFGLGDSGIETFRDSIYSSLARECAQNSSDAGVESPVKMSFDLLRLPKEQVDQEKQLLEAVKCCKDKAQGVGGEKDIDFFEQAELLLKKPKINVLRISDFNTKGLIGPCTEGTPFHSLVKASGVSQKDQDTSGGSFGIGKNAVFASSNLQTVFYSTQYTDGGKEFFLCQGKSILISHRNQEGIDCLNAGYWGTEDNYLPIESKSDVPDWLLIKEQGTSIFSIGFREEEGWQYQIAASLISNFFIAIHEGELEFNLNENEIIINSETIFSLFCDEKIVSAAEKCMLLDDFNYSKDLYDCLTSVEAKVKCFRVERLGEIEVRVLVRDGLKKRLSIARNGMLITSSLAKFKHPFSRFPGCRDFVAIVRPMNKKGSSLIKTLENPRHDGLSADRIMDEKKRREAFNAMKDLGKNIRNSIRDVAVEETKDVQPLDELTEFFADEYRSDQMPDPLKDSDPENYIYEAKKSNKTKKRDGKKPSKRKDVKGDTKTQGGEDGGNRKGKGGKRGKKSDNRGGLVGGLVELSDVRNVHLSGSRKNRRIWFTSSDTVLAKVSIYAAGMNNRDKIMIGKSSQGDTVDGDVELNLKAGERYCLNVDLSEDYQGPIEVEAKG